MLGPLHHYPATGNPYNFAASIMVIPLSAMIAGLVIGVLEVYYFSTLFVHRPFVVKLVYKTLVHLSIVIVFLMLLSWAANAVGGWAGLFDKHMWHLLWGFMSDFAFWSVAVYVAGILGVSVFYNEVSENLGHGMLTNFFTGKYHTPTEEHRIFMFLDMKSSTTLAEKLGHVRYFEMLREYYSDLSAPIIKHAGEIYQYVGDEVIVSWTLQNGTHNANCIRCFFALKGTLEGHAQKYEQRFGYLPRFKAAFHVGQVTTGEIGALKKEIIFTGDVLNTTARIQALCNTYNVDLLVSEVLVDKLELPSSLRAKALGEAALRGRDEKVKLFTMEA